jgi:hypothetical protein
MARGTSTISAMRSRSGRMRLQGQGARCQELFFLMQVHTPGLTLVRTGVGPTAGCGSIKMDVGAIARGRGVVRAVLPPAWSAWDLHTALREAGLDPEVAPVDDPRWPRQLRAMANRLLPCAGCATDSPPALIVPCFDDSVEGCGPAAAQLQSILSRWPRQDEWRGPLVALCWEGLSLPVRRSPGKQSRRSSDARLWQLHAARALRAHAFLTAAGDPLSARIADELERGEEKVPPQLAAAKSAKGDRNLGL